MKKLIAISIIVSNILAAVPVYAKGTTVSESFKVNSGYIYLDNKLIEGESLTYNNVTYLPVRKISEATGLNVSYDSQNSRINLTSGTSSNKNLDTTTSEKYTKTKTDNLSINSVDVYIDGNIVKSDNVMYNGVTYLPLRKIAETVGLNVSYETSTGKINLSSSTNTTNNIKPVLSKAEITYPENPKTVEDMKKVLLYMANYNLTDLDIRYVGDYSEMFMKSHDIENNMYAAFQTLYSEYVELFSGVENISKTYKIEEGGQSFIITIHLIGSTVDEKSFIETQKIFEEEAYRINESLKQNGTIKSSMTDYEIAKALYTYVDKTLEYDYATGNGTSINKASYMGYGAVTSKKVVCQGYTALYNYLLKLNGIKCYGQSGYLNNGTLHIWTVAELDGEKTYIDTTFGDTSDNKQGDADYKYFDIEKSELSKDRSGVK